MPTFSYTLPITTALAAVRSRIGDTDYSDPLLYDEEVIYYLTAEGGADGEDATNTAIILRASIVCAEAIAGKFARKVTTAINGTLSKAYSDQHKHYLAQADRMRRELGRTGIMPTAGGLSISGKQAATADTDRVPPVFARDQFTEPGTEPLTGSPFPSSADSLPA